MIKLVFETETGSEKTYEAHGKYQYSHACLALCDALKKGWKHVETIRTESDDD